MVKENKEKLQKSKHNTWWNVWGRRGEDDEDSTRDGTNADKAIPCTKNFSEIEYIHTKFKCPSCKQFGNKTREGHAIMARKFPGGKGQIFDLSGVICQCGVFSTFWMDITTTSSRHSKNIENCKPNGTLHFISGHDPLPVEARRVMEMQGNVIVFGEQKKIIPNVAGPVQIHSQSSILNDKIQEQGCGHCQFSIIGPTIDQIIEEISRNPMFRFTVEQKGNCIVCKKPLKNVWIILPEGYSDIKVYENMLLISKPKLASSKPGSGWNEFLRKALRRFTDEEIRKAQSRVIYLSGNRF